MMALKDAGLEMALEWMIMQTIIRMKEGTTKMQTVIETQQLAKGTWDLAADKLQMKKEYEDWMAEQNRLSDDQYGIVRDLDSESE